MKGTCVAGKFRVVQKMLDLGASPDYRDKNGVHVTAVMIETPLNYFQHAE